jgi:hypothetical protein
MVLRSYRHDRCLGRRLPIAPTPFTQSGKLDPDGMIDQKVDGICILANYSEPFLPTDEERDACRKGPGPLSRPCRLRLSAAAACVRYRTYHFGNWA